MSAKAKRETRIRRLPEGPFWAMTWGWTGERGSWETEAASTSMTEMMGVNPNWVVLAYAAMQDTAQSTEIHWRQAPTVTDAEILGAAARARALGLRVCLKPIVNVSDGTWRAHIGFFDLDVVCEPTWDEWFDAYDEYILHHARLAQECGADMFSIGCELVRADAREARWRSLAERVRAVYEGPITYNCDKYQEDRLSWWDAVDVISSSGYYPTGSWPEQLQRISAVVDHHQKDFVFLEAGCPSRDTSPQLPNDWSLAGKPDEGAQARYLDEMFMAFEGEPWVRGVALWDWPASLYAPETAGSDDGYCMYAKEGAAVVARHFSRR